MKLHLDNVNFSSRTGPHTFGQRLAKKLIETGHDVVLDDGSDADASIVFIEPSGRPLAKKVVQRLDGIWFKPQQFKTLNVKIKALYEKADGVIFQSSFDFYMVSHYWGENPNWKVVRNGIDAPHVKVSNIDLLGLRDQFKTIFVCSANWHPQKRLRANIEFFLEQLKQEPNSCLIVMGSNPDVHVAHPKIFYTGSIPHELCLEVYRIADWMIHLAWLDHCPNVVVEALSQETPVICSFYGGTSELIGDFGLVVPEQTPYGFDLVDYDRPPEINVSSIVLPERSTLGKHIDISMDSVVRSYIELIERIA
jgi:glycosyltransferase involved in cell wall biosynthesis